MKNFQRGSKVSIVIWRYWKGLITSNCIVLRASTWLGEAEEEVMTKWPDNPYGYLFLGWVRLGDVMYGSTKFHQETIEKAMVMAQKALAIDDSLTAIHFLLCVIYGQKREYDKCIAEGERALALDPNGREPMNGTPMLCIRKPVEGSHSHVSKSNPT